MSVMNSSHELDLCQGDSDSAWWEKPGPQEHLDNTWADVFSALASKELNGTQTKGTALDIIIQI